jgi:hypothetical protein
VIDFAVVKRLSEAGLKLEFIKKVMDFLRSSDQPDRVSFYAGPITFRLIIADQNTDRMKIMMEKKRLPKNINLGDYKSAEFLVEEIEKNLSFSISEPFETIFAFRATSIVHKIIGIDEVPFSAEAYLAEAEALNQVKVDPDKNKG